MSLAIKPWRQCLINVKNYPTAEAMGLRGEQATLYEKRKRAFEMKAQQRPNKEIAEETKLSPQMVLYYMKGTQEFDDRGEKLGHLALLRGTRNRQRPHKASADLLTERQASAVSAHGVLSEARRHPPDPLGRGNPAVHPRLQRGRAGAVKRRPLRTLRRARQESRAGAVFPLQRGGWRPGCVGPMGQESPFALRARQGHRQRPPPCTESLGPRARAGRQVLCRSDRGRPLDRCRLDDRGAGA